ncbi:unnamed protein product (macronuclear) [Paramecium tetraurelia]|uniref:MORN repeat protein n=1 Tax=Paramecium tetraurelia TaxID=5888 RepID=A0C6C5_PARTE|nr:uncharacterized protein GSPATT00035471001 [Paramecium tetraurelia]CAK66342.1 unnamed protein product [Paramecium tetraurelia]|eukprot:XP_001433739.1 hypothetical protein (macronuclear) [Paramecium tetraurelia strain d4-2]
MRKYYFFCLCKAPLDITDFEKSTGIVNFNLIKKFYGNIYFNDQSSNFIIYQVFKNELSKQVEDYYGQDQNSLNQCENYSKNWHYDENYEDLNSGYFYGKRCGYGCEVTIEISQKQYYLYIGEFFNNKYHGKGTLKQLPMENDVNDQIIQTDSFFAGEKEKEIFYFLQPHNPKPNAPKVIKEYQNFGKGNYHGEVNAQNQKHGWGVFEFDNRNKYKGQWKDDKMHGTGHFTWANGEEYLGEYYNDKKHGFGRYIYQNKKEYLGQFYEGRQHGMALMKNSDSFNLQTYWNNGQYLI